MNATDKTRVTLTLDKEAVQRAKSQGMNLSAIASDAICTAVREAERASWIEENKAIIAEQDSWLEENGHPYAKAIAGPLGKAWNE